jgi:hypothetical protein
MNDRGFYQHREPGKAYPQARYFQELLQGITQRVCDCRDWARGVGSGQSVG